MSKAVFVGGPMMHAIEDAAEYHIPTRQMIESVLTVLDTAGFRVLSAHRTERWGKVDTSAEYYDVCQRDFAWMMRAEAFIAILPPGGAGEPMRSERSIRRLSSGAPLTLSLFDLLLNTHRRRRRSCATFTVFALKTG